MNLKGIRGKLISHLNRRRLALATLIHFLLSPQFAQAADSIPDVSTYLNDSIGNAIVKAIGMGMDYRAYEPATPLGSFPGFNFGVEVTLAKPPQDVNDAISNITGANSGGSSTSIPFIPSARLHVHKGIGENFEVGFSVLPSLSTIPVIGGSYLAGGDVKYCFARPEEGVIWSTRLTYNINHLKIDTITIHTTTISPQILISKKLDFADPYAGIGFQYTTGYVSASINAPTTSAPDPIIAPINLSITGSGIGATAFGGVNLRVPHVGFSITFEMAYGTGQTSYLGTKIGFAF